ncbi:MAG: hypothetical protein QM578_27280 [Pantoea sp.]|uniref:hypothetical protein n=1 Tax=Pantoea sp. TaxID=69393 RepID=UPI0039E5B94B
MKRTLPVIVCILLFSVAAQFFLSTRHTAPSLPFRCQTFTTYSLFYDGRPAAFRLAHDIRFYNDTDGYFYLAGKADYDNREYLINRKMSLTGGGAPVQETYRYRIAGTAKSPEDNIPDALFTSWLKEVTPDPGFLQLDLIPLDNHPESFIAGTPLAFLFICHTY